MACIEKIYSVSALIGGAGCNGDCEFCAGKYLRTQATEDNPIFWKNYEAAIKLSARYGGWSLSLTGSGEPTLYPESVTKALQIYQKCAMEGAYMPNVNLFTNGIKLGDREFCRGWLPYWRSLGLTNVAVSIHSAFEDRQAAVYGLKSYPKYRDLRQNVEDCGVGFRATVLLRKGEIDNAERYEEAIE
jgi:molybdenum cofactor biosynthesis enzyme MoaA